MNSNRTRSKYFGKFRPYTINKTIPMHAGLIHLCYNLEMVRWQSLPFSAITLCIELDKMIRWQSIPLRDITLCIELDKMVRW